MYSKFTLWLVSGDSTAFWTCTSITVEIRHKTWPTENVSTVETCTGISVVVGAEQGMADGIHELTCMGSHRFQDRSHIGDFRLILPKAGERM